MGISGTWDMVHDDWAGVLIIYPPDQSFNAVDGNCTYSYTEIGGTWTGPDGVAHEMRGTLGGGPDMNRRTGEPCPASEMLLQFNIAFGDPPQPFEGYLFTAQTRMAGYTWWEGNPFGWYALKRSDSD
jgi:hypothetical protein